MDWRSWEPTYQEILKDFGYDRRADEEARDLLALLLSGHRRADLPALRKAFAGREVCIAGPIPSVLPDAPAIAADAATWAFPRASAIVTDLDGDVDAQIGANARGVPLFVHAHGDNVAALRYVVPQLRGPVQGTTQAQPSGIVADYGGFTDGDRAACLAVHLGARSLVLSGFDLDEPWPKAGRDPAMKRRKLAWARRIIEGLRVPIRST